MALSRSEIDAIHHALTQTSGDTYTACKLLGCCQKTLHTRIRGNRELRERWSMKMKRITKTTAVDTISTTEAQKSMVLSAPAHVALPEEIKTMVNVEEEDKRLRTGLQKLGLSEEQIKLGFDLQDFYGKQFSKCVDMLGAGMVVTALNLRGLMQQKEQKLQTTKEWVREHDDFGKVVYDEEKETWRRYLESCNEYRRMAEMAESAALTRAKIEKFRQEMKGSRGGPRQKPGVAFKPLQAQKTETHIHAAAGSNLTITTNESNDAAADGPAGEDTQGTEESAA